MIFSSNNNFMLKNYQIITYRNYQKKNRIKRMIRVKIFLMYSMIEMYIYLNFKIIMIWTNKYNINVRIIISKKKKVPVAIIKF